MTPHFKQALAAVTHQSNRYSQAEDNTPDGRYIKISALKELIFQTKEMLTCAIQELQVDDDSVRYLRDSISDIAEGDLDELLTIAAEEALDLASTYETTDLEEHGTWDRG